MSAMVPDPADDLDGAIRHLEYAVRLSPNHPRYTASLGEACLLRGDAEAAIAPLQRSVQLDPHPRVLCLMALALLRLERPSDAEAYASAALEETAWFHRALFVRAEARYAQRDRAGAVADLRRARDLAGVDPTYDLRLAGWLVEEAMEMGSDGCAPLEEAAAVLNRDPLPPQREPWRYLRGSVALALGDWALARRDLTGLSWPSSEEVAAKLQEVTVLEEENALGRPTTVAGLRIAKTEALGTLGLDGVVLGLPELADEDDPPPAGRPPRHSLPAPVDDGSPSEDEEP